MLPRQSAIEAITGRRVARAAPLSGGCVGEVYRLDLDDGTPLVAKLGPGLEPEGWMLRYLATHSDLPVPAVIHGDDDLLLMDHVEAGGAIDAGAERHAAELLAALHGVTADRFGLERDTLIGGLRQPNPWTPRWIDFFREQRLLHMAGEAQRAGRLPRGLMVRIERLAARLETWLEEPDAPALIHGDAWGGNILCRGGRVAAFIDPAIYYADPEIELAFGTLFGTFGGDFFNRYRQLRPIRPGFFEIRRDLYNLYPLLVHVRLFGGSYVSAVERIVSRFE